MICRHIYFPNMADEELAPPEPSMTLSSQVVRIPVNLPLPAELSITGSFSTNWKRFKRAWNNYEIAARLKNVSNPQSNKEELLYC